MDRGGDIVGAVKVFIKSFNRKIRSNETYEVKEMYEHDFRQLTEKFFKASAWPTAETVQESGIIDNDENFLCLYKELYFRHIYSKLQPTLGDRCDSFDNYIKLFNFLLAMDSAEPAFEVPPTWLWDIIDEFIYQFQSFHDYRSNVQSDTRSVSEADMAILTESPHLWSATTLLQYLAALENKGAEEDAHPFFKEKMRAFACIGQAKVMCLLSDYEGALECVAKVDYDALKQASRRDGFVPLAQYCLQAGFAFMCLQRYGDVLDLHTDFLTTYARQRVVGEGVGPEGSTVKRITATAAMVSSLVGRPLSDVCLEVVRERQNDLLVRLTRGDLNAFEESFDLVAPKFVRPGEPNYDMTPENVHASQAAVFFGLVRQRLALNDMHRSMKMCTSVSMDKLAAMSNRSVPALRTDLLASKVKHTSLQRGGVSKPVHGGSVQCSAPVPFFVRGDLVHVSPQKTADGYGHYFMTQILKYENLIGDIRRFGR